jgi:GH24 family phage-related lysozyme (muramidase)
MMRLINMLKRHEGVRDKVYMCSAGYETIGVGRNISQSLVLACLTMKLNTY